MRALSLLPWVAPGFLGGLSLAQISPLSPGASAPRAGPQPAAPAPPGALLAGGGVDDCALGPELIVGTGTFPVSTVGATNGNHSWVGAACTAVSGDGSITGDVWFRWSATATGLAKLTLCATLAHTKVAIYPGTTCPAPGSAIACNDDFCGFASEALFYVVAGQDYVFQIGNEPSYNSTFSGTFTLSVVTPRPEDDCATPANLGAGPGVFGLSNVHTTTGVHGQAELQCAPDFTACPRDAWYTWTATSSGPHRISWCGSILSGGSPRVVVFPSGGCPADGTALTCENPFCSQGGVVEFTASAGTTYLLQVGGLPIQGGLTFSGNATIEPIVPPANDDCSSPFAIAGPGPHAVDLRHATTGLEGQAESACGSTTGIPRDAWYLWTASISGTVTMSFCTGTTNDTKIAAYPGGGCPVDGTALACDDHACQGRSQASFPVTAGATYLLQVGSMVPYVYTQGTFTMAEVSSGPGTPTCFGDGLHPSVTTPCGAQGTMGPCNNFGAPGHGCASSFHPDGARLDALGAVAADDVVLQAVGMNANGNCIFLKGDQEEAAGLPFGDGIRCASGSLIRLRTVALAGGAASFPDATETITLSARGGTPVGSGLTASYTTYYRNAAVAFCPPATFNAANGYLIVW